jgi:hypothetical protein
MDMCLSTFYESHQIEGYLQRERIPSKALLHSRLFASHFFDINPNLDTVTDPVVIKLFSSKFVNSVTA